MKRNLLTLLVLMTGFGFQAKADTFCTVNDVKIPMKLSLYTLQKDSSLGFMKSHAAVILKKASLNSLLTGAVEHLSMRAGFKSTYELEDSNGKEAVITVTTKPIFIELPKSRVPTRKPVVINPFKEKITASLSYLGKTHDLNCSHSL